MVSVGLVTLVMSRVGSVISTCVLTFSLDMSVFSGPMVPGSSGALPGQSSTTRGFSPACSGEATHINAIANAARFMVAPWDEGRELPVNSTAAYHDREGHRALSNCRQTGKIMPQGRFA